LNGAECGYEDISGGEADPPFQPRRQIGRRKALASKMPRQVAGADENDLFPLHQAVLIGGDARERMRPRRSLRLFNELTPLRLGGRVGDVTAEPAGNILRFRPLYILIKAQACENI
jgi:hypothetical protein